MPDQSQIDAIAQLMDTMGVTVDDLQHRVDTPRETMTFAAFVDELLDNLEPNTQRTYRTHLLRLREGLTNVCICSCPTCCTVETRTLRYGKDTVHNAATTFPADTHCHGNDCRRSLLSIPPFTHRPMRDGEFKKTELEKFVKLSRRIAQKTAHRNNRSRATKGLQPIRTDATAAAIGASLAVRRLFADATSDGLLRTDPAKTVDVPKPQQTRKRSMNDAELLQFLDAVVTGGNDPDLDFLIVWFHLETGARQQGGVGLTLDRVHANRVEVFEKFGVYRDQPVTPELCEALVDHARTRGGDACNPDHPSYNPKAPVFYYRPAPSRAVRPLTSKRYETLFGRIQKTLPFANEIHLTCHQLRKTGAVHVERIAGTQVARMWLGHGIRTDVDNYAQASFDELIEVHRIRFGDPAGTAHPIREESSTTCG